MPLREVASQLRPGGWRADHVRDGGREFQSEKGNGKGPEVRKGLFDQGTIERAGWLQSGEQRVGQAWVQEAGRAQIAQCGTSVEEVWIFFLTAMGRLQRGFKKENAVIWTVFRRWLYQVCGEGQKWKQGQLFQGSRSQWLNYNQSEDTGYQTSLGHFFTL